VASPLLLAVMLTFTHGSPLILKQDVLPRRLIIVDASDDHESVSTELYEISERLGFKNTVVVKSDSVNSARQRESALESVLADAPDGSGRAGIAAIRTVKR
jgi:16S rRNA C967 or C1407 C5-methylase (RsmB/RsmF family)